MSKSLDDYKREMVSLHYAFNSEEIDILQDREYIQIYDENEALIMERRKKFESDLDIQKTMEICAQLIRDDYENAEQYADEENCDQINIHEEHDPFLDYMTDMYAVPNLDLRAATMSKLGAIARQKDNIMRLEDFYDLLRTTNAKQFDLLQHLAYTLHSKNPQQLCLFFTGAAGSGKTYVLKLIMEICNRSGNNDGFCNAYITCASTGQAAVAIGGTTVHNAFKISISSNNVLSDEVVGLYRTLFKYVKVILIDEISMVGSAMLSRIDGILKQITDNHNSLFGEMHVILIGDIRQLPPVRATPIYSTAMYRLGDGQRLWRELQFYELTEVMRQENRQFLTLLTKLGTGDLLSVEELSLLESRFISYEEANILHPGAVRLFFDNKSVDLYNQKVLVLLADKTISLADDNIIGCGTDQQKEEQFKEKLYRRNTCDTGNLPRQIIFAPGYPYKITLNIEVIDGLDNGAIGELKHVEQNSDGTIERAWILFPQKISVKARDKAAPIARKLGYELNVTPIARRSATIPMNKNRTITANRTQFPLKEANALSVHSSQGASYDKIVYTYDRGHSQPLVYVALSRVTSPEGLHLISKDKKNIFYHGRSHNPKMDSIKNEFARLANKQLLTIDRLLLRKIEKGDLTFMTFNCQSLKAHKKDITLGKVIKNVDVILLSETWMNNDEVISIDNFRCIQQFARPNSRAAGVAIFQSTQSHACLTPGTQIRESNAAFQMNCTDAVGDLCAAEYTMPNGNEVIFISVYISPRKKITEITDFIHRVLVTYTKEVLRILKKNYHKYPMVIAGDFNVNFSTADGKPLIKFFKDALDLDLLTNRTEPTTKHGTTIDAVFARYVNHMSSDTYISFLVTINR